MIEPIALTLRFVTPAFLGGADQTAEFRTPPIKASIRHFWRMIQAARGVTDTDRLRELEHALFGAASGSTGHKSLMRLRLDSWERGKLSDWGKRAAQQVKVGKNQVPAALYLGYGPIAPGPRMKSPPALDADSHAPMRLAIVAHQASDTDPSHHLSDIRQALGLMHHFGTLGGRSRNGWGSIALDEIAAELPAASILVDWRDALDRDWPGGLGKDDRGALIWTSSTAHGSWEKAIIELAQIRAKINRAGSDRTLLSYPVTKQTRPGWNANVRLPSSLRFKVIKGKDRAYRARIAHFPCRPSDALCKLGTVSDRVLVDNWNKVHASLDAHADLRRVALENLA